MQRERNDNLDIDGKRTAERRFNYVPGYRELSPHEIARVAFSEQLSPAEQDLVSAWVRYALIRTRPATGWEYVTESARSSASELAELCSPETTIDVNPLVMAGAMLHSGYLPVRTSANSTGGQFVFGADYVGLSPEQEAHINNMIARLS